MTANKIKPGTVVRSHYKATWTGVVVAGELNTPSWGFYANGEVTLLPENPRYEVTIPVPHHAVVFHLPEGCVMVKVTHDRNGHPMQRTLFHTLHKAWLIVLN